MSPAPDDGVQSGIPWYRGLVSHLMDMNNSNNVVIKTVLIVIPSSHLAWQKIID